MAYNNKKFLDQGGTSYLWQMIEAELAKKQNTGDYATNTRVATAEGRITTLEGKHAVGKTVAQEIDDAAGGTRRRRRKRITLDECHSGNLKM
jgi:hypothetical protein